MAGVGRASEPPTLDVRGLTVEIDVPAGALRAVSGVDFQVRRGETFAIVGESGCGKTIASLAVMRLLPRRARLAVERIALGRTDLLACSDRAFSKLRGDRMSMIFQDPMTSLNPVYRIGDQLEEIFVRHGKGGRREARERARYLLDRVGVTAPDMRLRQYPHELSGGLRQRMMIAMALMCDPLLVIADEPTTALDVTVQAQILRILADLQREFETALVLITHDLGVVARMADRVGVMYAGRIVETGTVGDVFARPTHPYTQGLLDCIPDPAQRGAALGSIPGIVPALIGPQRGCAFRNRCGRAVGSCRSATVALEEAAPGHAYRCLHPVAVLRRREGDAVQ